jgi:hypothetical protein
MDSLTRPKAVFATDIFYILVSFCSKASIAFLYLRLNQIRAHSLAVWAILGACAFWAVLSIMLLSIRCHVGHPWATWDLQCSNFVRQSAVRALSTRKAHANHRR